MKMTDFHRIDNSMEDNDHFGIENDHCMLLPLVPLASCQYTLDYSSDPFFVRNDNHKLV